jgi:putative membrane protein
VQSHEPDSKAAQGSAASKAPQAGIQVPSDWRGPEAKADPRVELAAIRTVLALERTRMGAERTLLAVMRSGIALIGIGLAVFEFVSAPLAPAGSAMHFLSARNVGFALVFLGLGMLGPGIVAHVLFERRLRRQWQDLAARGLAPPELDLRGSVALALAVGFFVVGLAGAIRMVVLAGLPG